ncbi:MAG: hypothetical protein ABR583_12845 [Gaiellaceae bacterium]
MENSLTASHRVPRAGGRRRFLVVLAALGLAVAVAGIFTRVSDSSRGFDTVSSRGTRVSPENYGFEGVPVEGGTGMYLMGSKGGREFFRLDGAEGPCFGTGRIGRGPTNLYCRAGHADGFPSVKAPIIAAPAVEVAGPPGTPLDEARILSFEGFAADGIARIELVQDDRVLAADAVEDNMYSLDVAGKEVSGTRVVARDEDGDIVYEQAY